MAELYDYCFVDQKRVMSYLEQLSSPQALRRQQKCPAWGVSLSVTGPQVEGKQAITFRDVTVYEAITEVEARLVEAGLVSPMDNSLNYWNLSSRAAFFVKDTFCGQRAIIRPSEEAAAQGIPPIALWVLDPIVACGAAKLRGFLIECCNETDRTTVPGRSGYTALEFMLYAYDEQTQNFRQTLLGGNELPDRQNSLSDERFIAFARDPCTYLESRGVHLGPRKTVASLFRVRFVWDEDGYHHGSWGIMGIVGYPLYIREPLR